MIFFSSYYLYTHKKVDMSLKKTYINNKEICKVTFILPSYLADNAKAANIVGEFNNWDEKSTRMKMVSGKFIRSLKLQANHYYQFRYLVDGLKWGNDMEADAHKIGPFGSPNSIIIV
jgi:1,4-alpha-glucan branching enzyme